MNKRNDELYDEKYKRKINNIIDKPLNPDMDENDCRDALSLLAEAKRYVNNKIKVCRRRISELELEIEVLCANISDEYAKGYTGSVTEKKSKIENAQIMHPSYKSYYKKLYNYQEVLNGYLSDLENLSDKTFAVRKIADFEKVHFMYED